MHFLLTSSKRLRQYAVPSTCSLLSFGLVIVEAPADGASAAAAAAGLLGAAAAAAEGAAAAAPVGAAGFSASGIAGTQGSPG